MILLSEIRISIIICTCDRPTDLSRTLASLSSVQVPSTIYSELLVVENGIKRDAEALVAAFSHGRIVPRYVFEPIPGKSRALNRAIRESTGQILLFSDDDVRFPPDWVERMCEPIRTGRADAVAGGVAIAPHLLRPWMNHTHRACLASTSDYLSAEDPSEMCGANMAVSRSAFDQTGGFDIELGPGVTNGGEESLLSWQLKRAGFRIEGALDVQVEHHLDPRRLQYENWLNAARLQGRTRAYQMHHWFHQEMRFPSLMKAYFNAKLVIRRMFSRRRRPEAEGIPPWEMSYVQDISKCAHYARERHQARHYAPDGLRKIAADHHPTVA